MDANLREHYSVGPLSHLASHSSLLFPLPSPPPKIYTLSVCTFLELGPTHWSLLIRAPDAERGFVHEVTGSPLEMEYWFVPDSRPEDSIKESKVVECARFGGERLEEVRRIVESVRVPKAAMRDRCKRNCQDWVVEVLEKLGAAGIISEEPGRKFRAQIEMK